MLASAAEAPTTPRGEGIGSRYTVVTAGWQGDLVYTGSNVVGFLPEARQDGRPLRGRVRQEFIADKPEVLSMPVSGAPNIQCYPVLSRATASLTVREKEAEPRVLVPDSEWELARAEVKDGRVELTPSNTDLYIKGGFKPPCSRTPASAGCFSTRALRR